MQLLCAFVCVCVCIYALTDGGFKPVLQVTCVGHIIGAVIADTQEHSRRAAKAVKIKYEELKPIVTIQVI